MAEQRMWFDRQFELPMSVVDLFFFVAEHDDHHLARISEILWQRSQATLDRL